MAISLSSPVTGATMSGLTTPGYTLTADTPPSQNMRQWVVSGLTGTQTGVLAHSIGSPFTISAWKPVVYKVLAAVGVNGILKSIPRNVHKVTTRKAVIPLSGQAPVVGMIQTTMDFPAGADVADPLSIKAALSLHFAALSQQSSGIGDTVITGVL